MWEDQGAVHVRIGKTCWRQLTLTCWRDKWKNSSENLYWLIWYILYLYILSFRFDASTKKLFGSFYCHVVFFVSCLADGVLVQVNTANIQYIWLFLDFQIKYSWKSIISLLRYCIYFTKDPLCTSVLTTIFFLWLALPGMFVYLSGLAVKYVNLILWLKVSTS